MGRSSLIQLSATEVNGDDIVDPSETKGDTAHPEDVDVSAEEMSLYSSVVSDGESVSSLKKTVDLKKQPKKLSEDNAMAVFMNEVGQLGAQEGETVGADSQTATQETQ